MIAQAHLDLVLLAVLSAVSVLLIVAYHSQVPYPILLVIGGAALGFIPGIPDVELNPDVVLIIVLPPLLYAAAFFSSLRELRDNLREISMLAIGLVIFTMLGRGSRRPRGHRRDVVGGARSCWAPSCRRPIPSRRRRSPRVSARRGAT